MVLNSSKGAIYMPIKKSISLQEDVLAVAEKNARVMCNGNLSVYINSVIYNANKDEIDKLARENAQNKNKPKICGGITDAEINTICRYCGEEIQVGEKICHAEFIDGHKRWVHINCAKEG
jgi:hypothetical protein